MTRETHFKTSSLPPMHNIAQKCRKAAKILKRTAQSLARESRIVLIPMGRYFWLPRVHIQSLCDTTTTRPVHIILRTATRHVTKCQQHAANIGHHLPPPPDVQPSKSANCDALDQNLWQGYNGGINFTTTRNTHD